MLALGAMLAVSATHAGAANAASDAFEYKIWKGGAAAAGSATSCEMSGRYRTGSHLAFEYNETGLIMSLGYAPWKFPAGTQQPIRLSVDGKWRVSRNATVRGVEGSGGWVADIPIGHSDKVMQVLRRGRVLTVSAKPGTATYALTGTFVALEKLRDCYAVQVELSKRSKLQLADPDPFKTWKPISLRE